MSNLFANIAITPAVVLPVVAIPTASALPPVTAISGYGFSRDGAEINYVAIEFASGVLPQDVQAVVAPLGGCLAIPADGNDNFSAAISLLLIDSGNPDDNAAWLGIVHIPNGYGGMNWQTVEGDTADYLAFGKGGPANSPELALGAVMHAHSQQWTDAPIGTGESNVRRAVVAFPATMLDCDSDLIPDSLVLAFGLGSDTNGDGLLDWCAPIGDLDGDGVVRASDLSILLANWNMQGISDIDEDGTTGAADLSLLLANWTN